MSRSHPELPIDPDVEETPDRRLRARHLALVFIGGTAGTAARHAITLAFPPVHGVPCATFAVNITGAFLLGVLLEALARRGVDGNLRVLLGTGALGGFTTYSALAGDTAALIGGDPVTGATYAAATLVIGGLATWAGIALAAARRVTGDAR